jgi:U3 small nucleolar RNA-associated protein 15
VAPTHNPTLYIHLTQDAVTVEAARRKRLQPYDKLLKSFQYAASLDAALESQNPIIVLSLLQELVHRAGVRTSLSGRDEKTLLPILTFIAKHINNPRFGILIQVATILLDLYSDSMCHSWDITVLLQKIRVKVKQEIGTARLVNGVLGNLGSLFAHAGALVHEE